MKAIKYVCILAVFVFFSCQQKNNHVKKVTHQQRIVCISKQYTEIIFALNAQNDIVAVDLSSTYPNAAKKLPKVGYHRALTVEGIVAHQPDLILQDDNIGPPFVVDQLKKLKIPMKLFHSKASTIDSTKQLILEMGDFFKQKKRAIELCIKMDNDLKKLTSYSGKRKINVLIIHFGQASNVFLAVTKKNSAAKIIELAGGEIKLNGKKGMQHLSPEIIAESNPDVILLTVVGFDRLGSVDKIKQLPGLSSSKAAKNNKIYRVEEHDVMYFGPRTGENILKLQKIIHQ